MNLYMVYRLDRSDGQAETIRALTRPAHRAYMDHFAARVRLGGPVLDATDQACGGLMVIEAESEDAVRRMVAEDPFEVAGLSSRIDIYPFRWQTKRPDDLPPL
ncbi:YciI family protein [Rhodoferax sediminis]|jgi:uncharacterized protein YciI|uniref:YciI family protein n=1 Tax=Rhodoferax sediminis TaxID=2509614 RepID=A0A515DAD1_9BURK|nr:YciI family protein [Rhodoferax sediminis]QDL37368.1 YciI family protein [Rhodoferax sediminis]